MNILHKKIVIFGPAMRHVLTSPPNIAAWAVAIYLGAVILLEGTPWWYFNSYLAYAVAFIGLYSIRNNPSLKMIEFWLITAMIFWWWVCTAFSEFPKESAVLATYDTKIFIMGLFILLIFDSFPKVRLSFMVMLTAAFGLVLSGLVSGYPQVMTGASRIQGLTSNPNTYGGLIADSLLVGLIQYPMVKKKWKIFIGLLFVISIIGIIGTGSRAPALEVAVAIMAFFYFEYIKNSRGNIKRNIIFILLIVLAIVAIVKFFPESPLLQRLSGDSAERSTNTRISLFPYTLGLVIRSPLVGYGHGVFYHYSPDWVGWTHSSILELLFNTGFIGLFLYGGLYVLLWIRLTKLVRAYRNSIALRGTLNAIRAAIVGMIIYGFIATSIHSKSSSAIVMMIIVITSRMQTALHQDTGKPKRLSIFKKWKKACNNENCNSR